MNPYTNIVQLIERLHSSFGEVIKLELDSHNIQDCNHIQGMMLHNMGDNEMTVGDLTLRGCYLGSNVSYNVKKMVENGYLSQERSVHDRRSIHISLTDKGRSVRKIIDDAHARHATMLGASNIDEHALMEAIQMMERLDGMWHRACDLLPAARQFDERPVQKPRDLSDHAFA